MATANRRIVLAIPTDHAFLRDLLCGAARHLRARRRPLIHLPDLDGLDGCPPWVAGLIVPVVKPEWVARLRRLQRQGRPVVNVATMLDDLPLPSVVTGNHAIGALAAEHLLAHGHRRFGFLPGPDGQAFPERFAGFREALAAHQLPCELIAAATLSGSARTAAISRWIRDVAKPAAIFAGNDFHARTAAQACQDAGIAVPGHLAILGVGNDEVWCETAQPSLSSIDLDSRRIGDLAASLLLRLIDGGPQPPAPLVVPPARVVVRESTDRLAVADPRLADLLGHLRDHPDGSVDVAGLVSRSGRSRRSLELLCREQLGDSPARLVARARIDRAQVLLAQTAEPLRRIAELLGFSSLIHFARVFRRYTGMNPSAWRRQQA